MEDLDLDSDEQRPIKQSFLGSLRRDGHWKCLILTLLIAGCLSAIAWCRVAVVNKTPTSPYLLSSHYSLTFTHRQDLETVRESPCDDGYVYIPVAFVIMLYLVYLVECWHSHTRIELQYKVDINTVYDKVRDMREGVPIIWWKAICYHYVRRTRQVTRYRNGDAFTSTQVYYERVNTCTAGSAFNFTQCGVKDISRSLHGLENYPATKIRFSKGFSFASAESECEFEDQRAQFFQEYENRDDYMEGREGMDVLNVTFKEYMIAFADPDNLPWYVSHAIFWVASFLMLSWPLRVIIEFKTAHLYYHVHKLFGTNYVDLAALRGTLSRASTMNSTELEMNIRNNNFMVPSYSDAMLMNAVRRASLMSVMTTTGGTRYFSGNRALRSVTNPALHTSPSTTFIPGSLPSFPMTSVRRFQSCTAIHQGDKPPVIQSRYSILASLFGSRNEFSEENAANVTMDRRRWRRKRPSSGIPFSGSFLGSILPTTPESPEACLIVSESMAGLSEVAGGEDDGELSRHRRSEEDDVSCPVPNSACEASGTSLSRGDIPDTSVELSKALSRTFPSTPSKGDTPPVYTDALEMPRLDSNNKNQQMRSSRNIDSYRSRPLQYGESSVRPKLQHSESARLLGKGNLRYYCSSGQGVDPPLARSFSSTNACARTLSCNENKAFDSHLDLSGPSSPSGVPLRVPQNLDLEHVPLFRKNSTPRRKRFWVGDSEPEDSSQDNTPCQPSTSAYAVIPAHTLDQNQKAANSLRDSYDQTNSVQSIPSSVSLRRLENHGVVSTLARNSACLASEEGVQDRSGSVCVRARMLIPLRLPSVITPRSVVSDDEDMTPIKDSGSVASLSSIAGGGQALAEPPTSTHSHHTAFVSMLDVSDAREMAQGNNDDFDWRSDSASRFMDSGGSAATTYLGNSGNSATITRFTDSSSSPSTSNATESGTSATMLTDPDNTTTSLISPDTAQRCYRSIHCMETSL